MGQKERSPTLERIDDYYRTQGHGPRRAAPRDPSEAIRVYKARNTFTVLKNVADYMAGIRGRRKAVVFFSEGIDYDIYNPINNQYASDIRGYGQDAIAAATRAQRQLLRRRSARAGELRRGGRDRGASRRPYARSWHQCAAATSCRISQDSLRTLADETGGFAAVNSNDFSNSFGRIVRDNSSYYVLGYYSTDTRRDGQFRGISVRLKDSSLQVRARKGYVAPRGRAPAGTPAPAGIAASIAMREALDSPVPVTGLAIVAFAAPMAGSPTAKNKGASVLVVVEVDGAGLKFKEDKGVFANDLELAIVALDESAKVRDGAKDTAELRLKPDTHAVVAKNGVRLTRRIALPPGRYQLKIGARESVGGSVGSVMYDLDVPDFSKTDLALGGLLLTSVAASRMPTANVDAGFKDILPASPSALREFPSGDELFLAADVYDNKAGTPHRVEIRTTVTADNGTVVFSSRDERRSEELKGTIGTFGHLAKIPLKGVAPGRYVLKVEAQSLLSKAATAVRELEFTVR